MCHSEVKQLGKGVLQYQISQAGTSFRFQDWIEKIQTSSSFRSFFNDLLCNLPYPAFFWEVKPVTRQTLHQPFEFVIVKSTVLENVAPTPDVFAEHFHDQQLVATFPNLGRDAQLVVPTPYQGHRSYSHIGKFVRDAPDEQVQTLWQQVGAEFESAIGNHPKWLSTCGLGVFWLHVRIDSRPKYYQYAPYKESPTA